MTNEEFNEIFRKRTMEFAIRVIKFIESVPFNSATRVLSFQLGKAGTSVGANFRAFCRGRSKNEKFSKICIVVEEADESEYWLEIFSFSDYGDHRELTWLLKEIKEIIKITSKVKSKFYP
ncbi:MAG: four helix bundle protein [Saprospiraceae bacterium]|uniref:Four helix bundle protein n=1 Tax=Candidatus Opimibacter skivensis TaxID=2982028 RepID=A0A9D7SUS2_9BACT|nr:four helix bundle protein [Candidatus Opimibacter skivensis]